MTPQEIRDFKISQREHDGTWSELVLLREIAAQLAEIKELLAASTIAKTKD